MCVMFLGSVRSLVRFFLARAKLPIFCECFLGAWANSSYFT